MSTIKGGKKKRRGKNMNAAFMKPFTEPQEGQYFAKAIKPLGSLKVQLEVYYYELEYKKNDIKREEEPIIKFNKQILIGSVRGSMRKREYVNPNDIVLVSFRDFSKNEKIVDIVMKYPNNHHSMVKKHKFCPEDIMFCSTDKEDTINFMEDDASEDEDFESAMKFSHKKTVKKRHNDNGNYYSGINLPSFEDDNSDEVSELRECDEYGNFI